MMKTNKYIFLSFLNKGQDLNTYFLNKKFNKKREYRLYSSNNNIFINDNLLTSIPQNNDETNITNKYYSKNKLTKKDMSKIYSYLNNNKLLINESDLKNIKILEQRFNSNNFIPDYVLIQSIDNINYMEDDFINKFYNEIQNENQTNIKENIVKDIINIKLKFKLILNGLEEGRIYKMIFRWQSVSADSYGNYRTSYNTSPSLLVYSGMDLDIVLYKFISYLNIYTTKYNFSDRVNLDIFIKEWLSVEEFKSYDKIIDKIKDEDKKYKVEQYAEIKENKNIIDSKGYFDNDLLNKNRKFYLCLAIKGLNYGDIISEDDLNKYNLLNKLNIKNDSRDVVLYKTIINKNEYIIKVEHKDLCNVVVVYLANIIYNNKNIENNHNLLEIEKWKDNITYKKDSLNQECIIVTRISENTGHYIEFNNNDLLKVDVYYNSKKIVRPYLDFDKDLNIGSIDIETYNNREGYAVPYSIGFKTSEELYTTYIDRYLNSDDMILECINKIFTNKNHNIKLYAHNMSDFDGILILKSLMNTADKHDYIFKLFSDNEGKIMSIDIIKKMKSKKIIKISILDSCLLLPVSLDTLCGLFNTNVKKGIFPYDFISELTLNYKGSVPDFSFFSKISEKEYSEYARSFVDWDVKRETINYLEKDLISLYDVILKFNLIIFEKFKINITRVRTISGLAFLIFTGKYYDEKNTPIYLSKGKLERFIRKSYVGGIVDVNVQYTDYLTYKYDVNSHYPNAMLRPMPGGLARISSERNLDNIFGFVEAIVTAPSEDKLKVAILPVKIDGRTVLFRNTVKGVFFSEELKDAITYGYKVKRILSCVQFDKIEGTFEGYIKNIYACKSEAEKEKNNVQRYIYKLLLNSLYGRLGLKGKNYKLSLIENTKLNKTLHTENSEILYKMNNLNLVKSSGPIEPDLLKIITEEKLYESSRDKFNAPNPWGSNLSSVQYSAAITAYARMDLNRFKNIKDNEYLGGDTDSIIMSKPIADEYIGVELGKFKLEYIIKEGFYHSKKFYLLVTNEDKIIIKAKGIDNSKNNLNYDTFVELFRGNNITVKQLQFNTNYKNLNIQIKQIEKTIPGIENPEIIKKMRLKKTKFPIN